MGLLQRKQKIFYRKTKKGNILKIVREHYLRDDIFCGLKSCDICTGDKKPLQDLSSSPSDLICTPHHIIIDTNVALHQIDVLCHDDIKNVIVPQTVVQEVKHRSLPVYQKLRDLIDTPNKHFFVFCNEHHPECYIEREEKESANDRNDRAIRIATWWYNQHFRSGDQGIVLITNDRMNKEKATDMDLQAYTMIEYVSSLKNSPGLLDIVAQVEEKDEDGNNPSDQRFLFPPHWAMEDIR